MEILVVCRLNGPPPAIKAAGRKLIELGFRRSANGVRLPPGTYLGTWAVEDAAVTDIRNALIFALEHDGVSVEGLLVATFNDLAWRGRDATSNKP